MMGTAAHEYRKALVAKIWRDPMRSGWVGPWWKLSQRDVAAFKYWRDRGYIEEDSAMMRLTERGRKHYAPSTASE